MSSALKEAIRSLGYKLACREIYGENSKSYFQMKREHDRLLNKLYRIEKKMQ
jgi:hypothetical protein